MTTAHVVTVNLEPQGRACCQPIASDVCTAQGLGGQKDFNYIRLLQYQTVKHPGAPTASHHEFIDSLSMRPSVVGGEKLGVGGSYLIQLQTHSHPIALSFPCS